MGCCTDNQKKFNCGKKTEASCVFYKGYIPEYSELDSCVTIEETTEELYRNQENILKSIDTSELGDDCLDYAKTEVEGKSVILVKDVLRVLEEKVCDLMDTKEVDDSLQLDFKCLVSPCGSEIESLKDLLQVLINEICALKQAN